MLPALDMAVTFRLDEVLAEHDPPMSQSELARRSGVSFVTINAMVNNRTKQVSLATLDKICAALDVPPGELLARTTKGKRAR